MNGQIRVSKHPHQHISHSLNTSKSARIDLHPQKSTSQKSHNLSGVVSQYCLLENKPISKKQLAQFKGVSRSPNIYQN